MKIVIDTREQNPLVFRDSVVKTLKTGDYSLEGYEHKVAIERKSAADLFQTLGKGNKMFQKELKRSCNLDYFGIVIESPISVIQDKLFEGAHYSKMRGDVILSILFTLSIKYNVHVFFCNGRNEARDLVRGILKAYFNAIEAPLKFKSNDLEMLQLAQKLKRKWIIR